MSAKELMTERLISEFTGNYMEICIRKSRKYNNRNFIAFLLIVKEREISPFLFPEKYI